MKELEQMMLQEAGQRAGREAAGEAAQAAERETLQPQMKKKRGDFYGAGADE